MDESFSDKLWRAYDLAVDLAYADDLCRCVRDTAAIYGDVASLLIWQYVDGLWHKYHEDHATGRCSLADVLGYDHEAAERGVDAHIVLLGELMNG